MISQNGRTTIFACMTKSKSLYRRWPRRMQSHMANIAQKVCEENLPVACRTHKYTRTHSRGVAATAVSEDATAIGIDIELEDPARNWSGLLGWFAPSIESKSISAFQGVKGWTFLEAYYKAMGQSVCPKDLEWIIETDIAFDELVSIGEGALVYFTKPLPDMVLCIYCRAPSDAEVVMLPETRFDRED